MLSIVALMTAGETLPIYGSSGPAVAATAVPLEAAAGIFVLPAVFPPTTSVGSFSKVPAGVEMLDEFSSGPTREPAIVLLICPPPDPVTADLSCPCVAPIEDADEAAPVGVCNLASPAD